MRPSLTTVIDPMKDQDHGRLYSALTQLADQDPLVELQQDNVALPTAAR